MSDDRTPVANIPPFGLRLQPELKQRVEEAARASNRSLNSEIIARLEGSFNPSAELEKIEKIRELQGQMIESLSRENDAHRRAGIASERLLYFVAHAIREASLGNEEELQRLVEREKSESILRSLTTVSSIVGED